MKRTFFLAGPPGKSLPQHFWEVGGMECKQVHIASPKACGCLQPNQLHRQLILFYLFIQTGVLEHLTVPAWLSTRPAYREGLVNARKWDWIQDSLLASCRGPALLRMVSPGNWPADARALLAIWSTRISTTCGFQQAAISWTKYGFLKGRGGSFTTLMLMKHHDVEHLKQNVPIFILHRQIFTLIFMRDSSFISPGDFSPAQTEG